MSGWSSSEIVKLKAKLPFGLLRNEKLACQRCRSRSRRMAWSPNWRVSKSYAEVHEADQCAVGLNERLRFSIWRPPVPPMNWDVVETVSTCGRWRVPE